MSVTSTPLHDAMVCISCGVPATVRGLDKAHVQSRARRPDLKVAADNQVLMCRRCHDAMDREHKFRLVIEDGFCVKQEWSDEVADFAEVRRVRVVVDKKRGHLVEDDSVLSAAAEGASTGGTPSQRSELNLANSRVGSSAAAPSAGLSDGAEEGNAPPQGADVELSASAPSLSTPLDDWCQRGMGFVYNGERLDVLTDEWRWQVGEWLNEGEGMMPEEVYGYLRGFRSPMALRQYAWVAAKVTRVTGLSWSHCRAVAALPAPEQQEKLEKALAEGLSSRAMMEPQEPRERHSCPDCGADHQVKS